MSLIILGEAATKVMDGYAGFVQAQTQVPWRNMRGMRNRIAHGDFDINLDVVWDTVQTALPELLKLLPAVRQQADMARLFSRNVWMDSPMHSQSQHRRGLRGCPRGAVKHAKPAPTRAAGLPQGCSQACETSPGTTPGTWWPRP